MPPAVKGVGEVFGAGARLGKIRGSTSVGKVAEASLYDPCPLVVNTVRVQGELRGTKSGCGLADPRAHGR
ncbi:hypothetical protein HUT06_05275 [Actinomadura sp. NAK00032]|uniref:hypothetical protein n=1 Tax=Actinomadura sp. NAK00032 TaxID=2742128 RepID=UPI001590F76E|nr:hypothetical protein [Actinomadura sp. NAK00032]QKW33513.1 hypothetical protein HUT06_05275 [Actinomadura sp. NAK00032]